MQPVKIGIIGAGGIAKKMAVTLKGMSSVEAYAIASRSADKAKQFAETWGFQRHYGSYDEMLADPNVQLVYIATPHSEHLANAKACLLRGKAVLCEKAFTANALQAEELLKLAKEKGVFIAEALWTRYMPSRKIISDILASGIIGTPTMLSANLGYPIWEKERSKNPQLAGGALLDLGVYAINFALMFFGSDIKKIVSACTKMSTGVDEQETITFIYNDGRVAALHATMHARTDRQGIISGEKGHIIVRNINNPEKITVVNTDYKVQAEYDVPSQITGYEYQVDAAVEALGKGLLESPYMPHEETLRVMRIMDGLRKEWGVRYPFE